MSEKKEGSFSQKSFNLNDFHYVPNPDENIIANVSGKNINISGQIKEIDITKQDNAQPQINIIYNTINYQSFNPITSNENTLQNYTIGNILTVVDSQQNISVENKAILQSQIKKFGEECKSSTPDQAKLKTIFNYVYPLAKDVGLMLIRYGMDSGMLKL
jgi:hypothetical protein